MTLLLSLRNFLTSSTLRLASRMLPFGSILRGYPRLVRDLARELGKRCRLELKGEHTQIDREILDRLDTALNHIVRNALDHGLEDPQQRESVGKIPEGRLAIEAHHRAGRLHVTVQDDGRGPNGKLSDRDTIIPGTQVLKFVVEGKKRAGSATVKEGTNLRPHIPISAEEVSTTRVFEFHRRQGAWQINQEFFDEFKANACPAVGSTERWILRNGSGGWWHPIHIHLESHQIQKIDGLIPPLSERFKVDTCMLGPNTEAEILMKFRTFRGPFAFHCHNLEHEDMRMMFVFDPRTDGPLKNQHIQQFHP